MNENAIPKLLELKWREIRDDVAQANPALAQEIDELDPSDEYTLFKVSYPWGHHLLEEGILNLPNEKGEIVPIHDPSLNNSLKEKLFYNQTIPLGLVLSNTLELYINADHHVIPFILMPEGRLFGLWPSLQDQQNRYNTWKMDSLVAGTKSLIMLPKISDAARFKKLKQHFKLQSRMPKGLLDQNELFLELSNHSLFPEQWSVDVVYFSKKWTENKTDMKWRLFREFLLSYAWRSYEYMRNQVVFNVFFSSALSGKNLNPNPYLADTVKYLYAISRHNYPGFKIGTDSRAAPIRGFRKVFSDIYGIKYVPTMVHPSYLLDDPKEGIYYSLEAPTLMEFYPKSRKVCNKLNDLREVKHVLDNTLSYVLKHKQKAKESTLSHLLDEVSFQFFHSDFDQYDEIQQTHQTLKNDQAVKSEMKTCPDKPFCETSPFFRGCVRISRKKK